MLRGDPSSHYPLWLDGGYESLPSFTKFNSLPFKMLLTQHICCVLIEKIIYGCKYFELMCNNFLAFKIATWGGRYIWTIYTHDYTRVSWSYFILLYSRISGENILYLILYQENLEYFWLSIIVAFILQNNLTFHLCS